MNQTYFLNFRQALENHIQQTSSEMDAGKVCGMILINLQKAFDTVNRRLLLKKLSAVSDLCPSELKFLHI